MKIEPSSILKYTFSTFTLRPISIPSSQHQAHANLISFWRSENLAYYSPSSTSTPGPEKCIYKPLLGIIIKKLVRIAPTHQILRPHSIKPSNTQPDLQHSIKANAIAPNPLFKTPHLPRSATSHDPHNLYPQPSKPKYQKPLNEKRARPSKSTSFPASNFFNSNFRLRMWRWRLVALK